MISAVIHQIEHHALRVNQHGGSLAMETFECIESKVRMKSNGTSFRRDSRDDWFREMYEFHDCLEGFYYR